MSKVQRHSHDQQTIQNILDKILNKKLSNTFPGIFGSGKTVQCLRPKVTFALTVGFFFSTIISWKCSFASFVAKRQISHTCQSYCSFVLPI